MQIELGRFCQNEMELLRKLLGAQEAREELLGRLCSLRVLPRP